MANLNDLPPGLWLHFSEEREVYEPVTGNICHSTPCRRIRVTGAVSAPDYDNKGCPPMPDDLDPTTPSGLQIAICIRDAKEKFFRDYINPIIDAFLADKLPRGMAKWITREDV